MRLPAPQVLLVATGLFLSAAPAAGAAVAFTPCPQSAALQCGLVAVPLDRSGQLGGNIGLSVLRRVAPANPTNAAVLGLAGGPGQAAIPIAEDFSRILAPALATRDLLVFDQRGTGDSGRLSCPLFGPTLTAAGNSCATALGPLRGQFTTAASVEDIEALRAAIGYEKLVLYAVSYGTKVALDYAARYPARVESLVLDSVVLQGGPDTLQRSTFGAIRRVLGELCAGTECSNISRNPVADLAARVKRLNRRPLRGRLTDGGGRRLQATMNRGDLFNILLTGDRNPTLRAELPGALTSAKRGDTAPLLRLAARSAGLINLQGPGDGLSGSVFAATLCEESLFPWDRAAGTRVREQQAGAAVRALGNGPFYPFNGASALDTEIISLCLGWPVASAPPAAPAPLPNVPTLVINGSADIRTPLEDAGRVKEVIPGAQVLAIPFTGHSAAASDRTDEKCALRGIGQFFGGQPVTPCLAADNPFSATRVAPTRLARLGAIGRTGKIGRSVSAAVLTAEDTRRQVIGDLLSLGRLPGRTGGLRGGRATVSRSGRLTLHDVVYVPRVQISGSVPLTSSGTQVLRIRGSAAAHGSIRVTPTTITGTVGGRRIRVTARAAGIERASEPSPAKLRSLFRLRSAG